LNRGHGDYPQVIGEYALSLLGQLDEIIAEESIRENLKKSLLQLNDLRFALDESSIVAVTDRQGIIRYVNDKFCQVSKYSREELLGQDHRIINSGYHDSEFFRGLWRTIGRGEVWHGEIKNKAKDGTYYWVDTTIVPLLDASGKPLQYLAIRHEVTRLKAVEEELKMMMVRVMQIQEEERKRFSRELHDGIGQSLFSLLIRIDRLIMAEEERDEQEGQGAAAAKELSDIRRDVSHIIEEVRGLAWELRPSVLDDLGVVPAIRTYIENYTEHYGVEVRFTCDLTKRLDNQKETVIYRVIQEALTNIGKYADVDEAEVSIKQREDGVEALIVDRGEGFVRTENRRGVGLFSMEERARGVNGKLSVDSEPGKGTTVRLYVPMG
jgi:two-component system, NarL family, sensor histidine kinase NreB